MQGYRKEDGVVGVDDVVRWPLDSNAVSFLAQTTSTASITNLMEVSSILVGILVSLRLYSLASAIAAPMEKGYACWAILLRYR